MPAKSLTNMHLPDKREWAEIERTYQRQFDLSVACIDLAGDIIHGKTNCKGCASRAPQHRQARCMAVKEALQWGAPSMSLCPDGLIIWGVPIMHNNLHIGGLVVSGVTTDPSEPPSTRRTGLQIKQACEGLLQLAEEFNLTNATFLHLRRTETNREQEHAEAIHALKHQFYDSIRSIYLREEPDLLAAIKRGDRPVARAIINRVLAGIFHIGHSNLKLLKSFALELVVMMCRAAVEAGGDPLQLLGVNYSSVTTLASITDEDEFCRWLIDILERLMDGIRDNRKYPNTVLLENALRFMEGNLQRDISRNDVARASGLSPSHFSHLISEKLGRTFSDLLTQFRVDRAAFLLTRTDNDLAQIAFDCGFCDQSHFTKVFRTRRGLTPKQYREKSHQNTKP